MRVAGETLRRLRVAIVGAGVMGTAYAGAIARGDTRWRATVAGICDRDVLAADRLAGDCGAPAYTDLGELLDRERPDAVYVAVPDHLHKEPFLTCMEHRVPCLVEKPLATTLQDAVEMRDAARAAGVVAEVNFANRFNPAFVRMREAIVAGDVGEVVGVNARLSNVLDYPLRALSWAGRTTCGWFLLSHVFDLAHWLTGASAVDVTAHGVKGRLVADGVDTYDVIQSLVRYDAGFGGVYESAWVLPDSLPAGVDFKVELLGTEGALYVDTQDQMVHLATSRRFTYPGTLDWTQTRLSAFLDRVAADDVRDDVLDDGVENTALLVALHDAITAGSTVRIGEGHA